MTEPSMNEVQAILNSTDGMTAREEVLVYASTPLGHRIIAEQVVGGMEQALRVYVSYVGMGKMLDIISDTPSDHATVDLIASNMLTDEFSNYMNWHGILDEDFTDETIAPIREKTIEVFEARIEALIASQNGA